MKKWTEEETFKFTQLYSENECLWKLSSPDYKNKNKRREAIEQIVQEMKRCFTERFVSFSDIKAREKIKNLRCTYNQEISKIKNSKSNCGATQYIPCIKWFKIMDAIVKKSKKSISCQSTLDEFGADLQDWDRQEIEHPYYEQNYQISHESQGEVVSQSNNFSVGKKSTSGKRKLQDLSCAIEELRAASKAISESKQDMSDNEAFGTYVATCLDRLNPCEAVLCQQEIQKVITNYRLGQVPIIMGHETEVE